MSTPTPRTVGNSYPTGPAVPFVPSAEACAKADALEGDDPIFSMSEMIEITFMRPSFQATFSGKNMLDEALAHMRGHLDSSTCSVVTFPILTTESGEKVSMKCVLPNVDADLLKLILSRAERCTYEAESADSMVATTFGMPVLVDVDRVRRSDVRRKGVEQGIKKKLPAHFNAQAHYKTLGRLYESRHGLMATEWYLPHTGAMLLKEMGWAVASRGNLLITSAGILAYEAACSQAD